MTALVSIFNLLRLYFDYYVCFLIGGNFNTKSYTGEFHKIGYDLFAQTLISQGLEPIPYNPYGYINIDFEGVPLFQIGIGIFVIGAIIGLARRLIRG